MSAQDQSELQTALGAQYTLEREIGRGGMATVYLARDLKHQRQVALKVIHPDLSASLGPDRFRREISIAARLQHPHLLSVFDSGETESGLLWFTMPFVEGETLRGRLLREKQLPVDEVIRITREIAGALDYAHAHGVIHRDIKPENILLTTQGDAILADFGIAQAFAIGVNPSGATPAVSLTQTGLAIGTPQYMSPEQATGDRVIDARSDIFALGAVAYEMFAGVPPFAGPTAQAILAKLMSGDPAPVAAIRPTVSKAVDTVLGRALAAEAAQRWNTAGDFARALDEAQRSNVVHSTVPVKTSRKRMAVLATIIIVIVTALALFNNARSKSQSAAETQSASGAAVRLAVLPFENVGDSADGYFADGMTEAVHDKLTSVPGIEVVGSASSRRYLRSTLSPQQIGQELGVRYLLEGYVRWAKAKGGPSRVRVSPELVEVSSGASRWAEPFDAPLTDVFDVQGEIAGKVSQALQVALSPKTQKSLTAQPTKNLAAYDSYLRGLSGNTLGNSPRQLHRTINAFREAVDRDSMFALAWGQLGAAYGQLYYNGETTKAFANSADYATARALAIDPNLPELHAFRALYYLTVANDARRALSEAQLGLRHGPTTALLSVAARAEMSVGAWNEAEAHAQQASEMDPLNTYTFYRRAAIAMRRHRISDARAQIAHAIALNPTSLVYYETQLLINLGDGDLAAARRDLNAVPSTMDRASLIAYVAQFADLGWALDSGAEQQLLRMRPDAFDNDTASWALALAQQYMFRGDKAKQRAYADRAVDALAARVQRLPNDDQNRALHGVALALAGRKQDAIREGLRSLELRSPASDANDGPYNAQQMARIYAWCGEPDKALDLLEQLVTHPFWMTRAFLKIDPNFRVLRGNPRFERIVAGRDEEVGEGV